jgi:hypothetical protein
MDLTTEAKRALNRILRPLNARVDSLTVENRESQRLERLVADGHFDRAVFPVPPAFENLETAPLLREVARCGQELDALRDTGSNEVGYTLDNSYFSSPDAEILYAAISLYKPSQVVEVGSGNSTKLIRQAIIDQKLQTRVVAIDPSPRSDVEGLVDEFIRTNVEFSGEANIAKRLGRGDMLLIDSSHEVRIGNDVAFLYLNVIPKLASGVFIHIHDIFLPYEYPQEFVVENRWAWCEQYIVQAMLATGNQFDVLWAGHFLQRTVPDFGTYFPLMRGGRASSLLLRKR